MNQFNHNFYGNAVGGLANIPKFSKELIKNEILGEKQS